MRRVHFQESVWKAAFEKDNPELVPTGYEWGKAGRSFKKSLLQVSVPEGIALAPLNVDKEISCGCKTDQPCANDRCMC